ncbi:MAG: LysR family transcriptional regulator [Rhodothalassiaceae bacterium]
MQSRQALRGCAIQEYTLDWADIALFLAAAEAGTLSRAARSLGCSQPTVGRRLDALEKRLGTALFVRTARGLRLTDVGFTILENAERMRAEARAILRLAEGHDRGLAGPVTISVVEGMSHLWLIPQLRLFQERYPEIHVRVRVEDEAADLVQREADIALRMFRPQQNSLIAKRAARIAFGIFAAKSYLARAGTPHSLADLESHRIITGQSGSGGEIRGADGDTRPLPGRVVFSSNSPEATMAALVNGLGVGVHCVAWARGYADLVQLLPDVDAGNIDVWLVTHEDLRRSARIRALFDFLAERLAADAPIFAGRAPPNWPFLGAARAPS